MASNAPQRHRRTSTVKLRVSLDDEQRARLLEPVNTSAFSPDSHKHVEARVSDALPRRRRPLALVCCAVVLIMCSAGAYTNREAVDILRNNAGLLGASVQSWLPVGGERTSLLNEDLGGEQLAAAESSPAQISEPASEHFAPGLDLSSPLLPVSLDGDAAASLPHAVAPPDVQQDLGAVELAGVRTGDTPSSTDANANMLALPAFAEGQQRPLSLKAAPIGFPAYISASAFMDTRPRPRLPPAGDAGERYLSYNPHSGFHNQRIEFENAIVLAQLLNRTLLAPLVRLGRPQGWMATPFLQTSLERDEKHLQTACIDELEQLESQPPSEGPCENYTSYTLASWDTLVDLTPLESDVKIVERTDISRSWFTSPDGLGLQEQDIESFRDPARYSIRFYDARSDHEAVGRYKRRLDIEALRDGPLSGKRLLEFGSFFGSGRIKVTKAAHRQMGRRADEQMVFRNPLLASISNELVDRLGGRDAYLGLHLRVGDGPFARAATKNMQRVFRTMCQDVFKLDRNACTALYNRSRKPRKHNRHQQRDSQPASYRLDRLDAGFLAGADSEPVVKASKRALHPSLACHGQLHTDPKLEALNMPVYIATDARTPRRHPDLAVFFNTLPCAFVLGDFSDVPGLQQLAQVRSLQEGVKMAPFLYPFLEGIMAARSRVATIGTPGSTFSGFAATTLHRIYAQEESAPLVAAEAGLAVDNEQ